MGERGERGKREEEEGRGARGRKLFSHSASQLHLDHPVRVLRQSVCLHSTVCPCPYLTTTLLNITHTHTQCTSSHAYSCTHIYTVTCTNIKYTATQWTQTSHIYINMFGRKHIKN